MFKINTLPQRIIYSAAILLIGLVLSLALIKGSYNSKNDNISDYWPVWIAFILFELWIQSKIWDLNKQEIDFTIELGWFHKLKDFFKSHVKPKLKPILIGLLGILILAVVIFFSVENPRIFESGRLEVPKEKKVAEPFSNTKRERISIPLELVEFDNGLKLPFITDGSGKAKGLKFMISYPVSYNKGEVNRPDVVANLSNPNLTCNINILVKKYPNIITEEQQKLALSYNTLVTLTKAMNLELISSGSLSIDGQMAAYTDGYIEKTVEDVTYRAYKRTYYTYYQSYAMEVHFYIGGYTDKDILQKRFLSYEPLFSKMINSLTILSKGKRKNA